MSVKIQSDRYKSPKQLFRFDLGDSVDKFSRIFLDNFHVSGEKMNFHTFHKANSASNWEFLVFEGIIICIIGI